MQAELAGSLAAPWAVLPDRLPFIRSALNEPCARRWPESLQAPILATVNAARRKGGNGAIAILPFYGLAVQRADAYREAPGLLSLWHFKQTFRTALADNSIGGILLDIDSPGGSVYGVIELADEIYRSRTRKPIFAVANSLAAAGAYWIASAANEFYVTPGGEVGGIGVYDMHVDVSKGLEKAGISTTMISAGKYKTERNPFQPLGGEARASMQKRVDEYYRMFVGAIAKHRGIDAAAVRDGMGQGRVLGAQAAKAEGMVDDVMTFDEVLRKLVQRVVWASPTKPARTPVALMSQTRTAALLHVIDIFNV